MSVSFLWELVEPERAKAFRSGTSSDMEPLEKTFGGTVSTKDIPTLRAMHRASGLKVSLWSEIADTLERLQGEDEDAVTINIWPEF